MLRGQINTREQARQKANWHLAVKIYNMVKAGQRIENVPGLLPAHYTNVMRAINNLPLSGPKVSAFADNLNGNLERVTVDVWMQRFYPGLSNDDIISRVKRGAKRCGMKPAEYQALIWTKSRIKAGKKSSSYNLESELFQKSFDFMLDKVC